LWLNRAIAFLNFALDHLDELLLVPDEPYGLVNGIGGLVYLIGCVRKLSSADEKTDDLIRLPFF
jgi:hypothetical protein